MPIANRSDVEDVRVPSARGTLLGSARVFLAEALLVPTGLLTVAYLAREFGPRGYGVFTLSSAVVTWIEWTLSGLLARASVKLVADASDWRPVGATIASAHLLAGLAGGTAVLLLATPLAALLGEPELAGFLRLWAIDIPLFTLAQGHRHILVGIGKFSQHARASAARWIGRFVLIVVLVEAGLSLHGAVLGCIGASALELAVARAAVRPRLSLRAALEARSRWRFAAPLVLSAVALRVYDRLDLFALTALGGTVEQAGWYGAAQSLALLPMLFLTFPPVLLSSLSIALRLGEHARARQLGSNAIRAALVLLPFAALTAGCAREIVVLVFGSAFAPAAPVLPLLMFAAVAVVLHAVATTLLVSAGRTVLTFALTAMLPLLALAGYPAAVPRLGPVGAGLVTLASAACGTLTALTAAYRVCKAAPPAAAVLRTTAISLAAYSASLWPAAGWLVLVKLVGIGALIPLAFVALGELSRAEMRALRSLRTRGRAAGS